MRGLYAYSTASRGSGSRGRGSGLNPSTTLRAGLWENAKKMIIDIDKYGIISKNEAARRSWQAKGI